MLPIVFPLIDRMNLVGKVGLIQLYVKFCSYLYWLCFSFYNKSTKIIVFCYCMCMGAKTKKLNIDIPFPFLKNIAPHEFETAN